MRAKYAGKCRTCQTVITPGQELEMLLRSWVHAECKKAELTRRQRKAGPAVELEPAEVEEEPQYVGTRNFRRRDGKFMRLTRNKPDLQ